MALRVVEKLKNATLNEHCVREIKRDRKREGKNCKTNFSLFLFLYTSIL